ncbi:general substrate transporter [Aspergillus piperis CBS 112811]|uniref:General substrate transporter n=1 Tax=Aspergillus piperis CBS 112811 TaxID=1448313 RepID=A0A8G1VGX2_9EURO|nr:general substrate transporter [Aspergillus piperis CBS 112811]RAH51637.1 general substrate transporter [Aspergillus piperis CBS 112811]
MHSPGRYLMFAVTLGSGSLIGFESGYLNGVLASDDFIHRYGSCDAEGNYSLSPTTRSLFTSMLIVGALIGCCSAPLLQKSYGFRGRFLLGSISLAIGIALQLIGKFEVVFILGRVLEGYTLGIISTTVPSYLIETVPSTSRGLVIGLYEQVVTMGLVTASGGNYGLSYLSGSKQWRIEIAIQFAHAMLLMIAGISNPESPRHLAKLGNHAAARTSLGRLRGLAADSPELDEAIAELQIWLLEDAEQQQKARLRECFEGPNLRRLVLGCSMGFHAESTGIVFFLSYSTTFLAGAGITNAYLITFIIGLVMSASTLPSIYCLDHLGRRSCAFIGGTMMLIVCIVTGAIHSAAPLSAASQHALIAGSLLFIFAYASSWGSLAWLVITEAYSSRLRTYQSTISMCFYWISQWIFGFITPYMVDESAGNLGVNMMYVLAGFTVLSLAWAYFYLPELSGLTQAEVNGFLFSMRTRC